MISFSTPAALLLFLPVGAVAFWAWRQSRSNLSLQRRVASLGVRVVLLAAVVLGLSGLALRLPEQRISSVFVADTSASDARDRSALEALINNALATRSGNNLAGVVSTAADAAVEQPATTLSSFDGFQSTLSDSATNLERGLDLAGAIEPPGYRRRVVLMSDGRQTEGDAVLAARLLRAQGIRVDVLPASVKGGPDVLVDRISVPPSLRTRERFSLHVSLRSNVDTTTHINVYLDRTLVLSRQEVVRAGTDHYRFSQPPLARGFHSYRVLIQPREDSQAENDSGSAFTQVAGAPRVLVISESPSEAANVLSGLRSTGVQTDLRTPAQVVPSLTYLREYASTIIVDTPAEALGAPLMEQLVPYVRDLGHGLVVIGGQHAFGLGAYGRTPLERTLPVTMDLPDRPDLPSVGVALIIESLEANFPVNISKQAAMGIVQLLTEQDQVAINEAPDDNTGQGWVVRLRPARDKGAIDRAIAGMQPGDPQTYTPTLQAAAGMLRHSPTRLRHVILLGDGDARDVAYKSVVQSMRRSGITVSTVITNAQQPSDFATMRDIAHWGGGRYYVANDVSKVPQIFLHEARTVARSGIVDGRFVPKTLLTSPLTRDLQPMPPLTGYVAVTPRASAEIELASRKTDPVLASWQFGLGRSVVWTSDAAGLWTRDFVRAPHTNRFWADLVSWTLPAGETDQLFVSTSVLQRGGRLQADVPTSLGPNPRVTAHIVGPGLSRFTVQLEPASPGRFTGAFDASRNGAYFVSVEAHGAGRAATGQSGAAVSYPAEYRATGTDLPFLREVARAGGGTLLRNTAQVWSGDLPAVDDSQSLTDLLWVIALLLLPIDIAVRRLIVSRRDIDAIRAALRRRIPSRAA